jgi:lysophospholipase L1-like esterase
MMLRFLTTQALALGLLVAPLFGGDNNNFTYLALGDSIAFGYNPTLFPPYQPASPVPTPDKFVGYPERVAEFERLQQSKEVNAACPGETSGSFLNVLAPDNGCHPSPGPPASPGFKAAVGLHTNYIGSQASFAVSELASNKHINLVTLSIGGNDLLLLQEKCLSTATSAAAFDYCVEADLSSSTGTLAVFARNLGAILGAIRANYQGTIIVMKSYAPSADPLFVTAIKALNDAMVTVANTPHANFDVKFADGFTAFQIASAIFGYDPCKAGLLIRLSKLFDPLVCDVHPSPLGRDILALTVLVAH